MTGIPTRRLGRTNRFVTEIGLGGAGLNDLYGKKNDDAQAVACVHRALELGVRLIDTSPLYGESERRIGLALTDAPVPRDAVFLATKTGTGAQPKDYSGDGTQRSVARSLERLKTDRLDLVQIHDPEHETHFQQALAPGGALDTLLELKAQGVVGGIGIGVRSHDFLRRAIRHGAFDTILTYADFNPARQTAREALFPEAEAHDVGVLLGSPLLFGYFSDRPFDALLREHNADGSGETERRVAEIRDWCAARGLSILAFALQFALRERRIGSVLIGAASPIEIEQNVVAATDPSARIPDEIWRDLADQRGIIAS